MSSLFIGLFTFLLILDCLFLGLLVLMQLPKKDAGVGMAFGGGTADALFGAGSGNLLTKLTKYTAGIFFALILILSFLKSHGRADNSGSSFKEESGKLPAAQQFDSTPAIAPTNTAAPSVLTVSTNSLSPSTVPATTNISTNTSPAAPK